MSWKLWRETLNPQATPPRRVTSEHLASASTVLGLWRELVEIGEACRSEADFHSFLALCETARRKRDPASYLWECWRRREFGGITQADEDQSVSDYKREMGWLSDEGELESIGSIVFRVLRWLHGELPLEQRGPMTAAEQLQRRRVAAWGRVRARRQRRTA